jgi:GrpB-like predicted nucleotidyltransferase (UPF0157 family)
VKFRDYLRRHPDTAREYGSLKKTLAERYADDPIGYLEAKSEFIGGALAAARR